MGKELMKRIDDEVQRVGWELESVRKVDENPSNDYLRVVLAKKRNGSEYVTWIYNDSYMDGGVLSSGHYFFQHEPAREDFKTR